METKAQELKEYHGNCHCGAFRYTMKVPVIEKAAECNCSYCTKVGYFWVFASEKNFHVNHGKESDLSTYSFGKKSMAHKFCPKCGVNVLCRSLSSPTSDSFGINGRTIKHEELDLPLVKEPAHYQGKGYEPQYQPPEPAPTHLQASADTELHHGNCHCGAVTYTLRYAATTKMSLNSCNCSTCFKHGTLWLYPNRVDVDIHGVDALKNYKYLGSDGFYFCPTCGVTVAHSVRATEDETMGLNIRSLEGTDVGAIDVYYENGWDEMQPQYSI